MIYKTLNTKRKVAFHNTQVITCFNIRFSCLSPLKFTLKLELFISQYK